MAHFPENFPWGAASASYQIEGGVKEGGRGGERLECFLPHPRQGPQRRHRRRGGGAFQGPGNALVYHQRAPVLHWHGLWLRGTRAGAASAARGSAFMLEEYAVGTHFGHPGPAGGRPVQCGGAGLPRRGVLPGLRALGRHRGCPQKDVQPARGLRRLLPP